jgi:hypothetical protein
MDINYEEIDVLCRPLVRLFNEIGLKTVFSCQGHDDEKRNSYYVIFDESVSDESISEFLVNIEQSGHTPLVGEFHKWMRSRSGRVVSNWMYCAKYGKHLLNQEFAKEDYDLIARKYKAGR